jgi:hypothetical protein
VTDTNLHCAAPDYSLPQFQPMTCGFPAAYTATADDGSTVGLYATCGPTAVVSGYKVTAISDEPEAL